MNAEEASDLLMEEFSEKGKCGTMYIDFDKYKNDSIDVTIDGDFTLAELKRIVEVMEMIE